MKIEQPNENCLYVTIGNFTYYFDDSIDGECTVNRWHKDDDDINEDPVFHAHLKHMESEGEFFSKYKAKTNKPK